MDENASYTGVSQIDFSQEQINEFEVLGEIDLPLDTKLNENQAVIMKLDGTTIEDIEQVPIQHVGRVQVIRDENENVVSIKLKKLIDLDEINFPIRPRNLEQHIFIDLLCNDLIPLKTSLGQAGSGKTFLMVSWAVWKVLTQPITTNPMKIFITRPSVEMGQKLGFLPGNKDEKMAPYLDPFKDALETLANIMNERGWHPLRQIRSVSAAPTIDINPPNFPDDFWDWDEPQQKQFLRAKNEKGINLYQEFNRLKRSRNQHDKRPNRRERRLEALTQNQQNENSSVASERNGYWSVDKLMKDARIETMALQYIRGRSLKKTIVLADEMQNDTPHVAKSLGTRIADGSFVVMAGDLNQIDSPFLDKQNNGLSIMIDRMMGSPAAGHFTLLKNERGFLSKEITKRFGDVEEE